MKRDMSDSGWPHVTPVWFEYDGENFWVPTQATTKKATDVKKDKRVGLIIDTLTEPISKFNILTSCRERGSGTNQSPNR